MAAATRPASIVMMGPASTAGCCLTVTIDSSDGSRYRLTAAALPDLGFASLIGRRLPSRHHLAGYAVLRTISQPLLRVMPWVALRPARPAAHADAGRGRDARPRARPRCTIARYGREGA